jgi:phenylalanyl-tRNA synthetase beta subunit
MNQKIPFDKFAIFEINKVYQKEWGMNDEKVPVEKMQMGFVVAERKNNGTAYYKAKKYVEELLKELNIKINYVAIKNSLASIKPFEKKRAAEIVTEDGTMIGVVGEFKNSVRQNFKLAEYLAGFELDIDLILERANQKKEIYLGGIEKRDLTIKTKGTYAELIEKINKILVKNSLVAEITPLGIYQPENSEEKNISVHLEFHQKIDEKIMHELESI